MSFAPGAVLALFHDVSIVVGVFVTLDILGITYEFNLPMIGALLTIIGYSLNDTIVIYDRLRENMTRYRRNDLETMINVSINETLGRTLATSVTTLAGMTAFLGLGWRGDSNLCLGDFPWGYRWNVLNHLCCISDDPVDARCTTLVESVVHTIW